MIHNLNLDKINDLMIILSICTSIGHKLLITLIFVDIQQFSTTLIAFHLFNILWKSHATLTLLAKQDLPTFGYNMIAPLKSWCWGSILFYPFKISRFS